MTGVLQRVLFVDQADFVGGAERILAELISRMDPRRFESVAATNASSPLIEYATERGLEIKFLEIDLPRITTKPDQVFRVWRSVRTLRQVVRQLQIDVMVTNTVRAHVIGALAMRKSKAKLVWYLHDDTFPLWLFRQLHRHSSAVLTVSEHLASHYSIDGSGVVVIHNGIDINRYRRKPQVKDDDLIVLHAGRLVRWKGQDIFVRAASRVASEVARAEFRIVGGEGSARGRSGALGGGSEYLGELLELVRELGMEDRIRVVGEVRDLSELLESADLFVHSSIRPEPFGLVILEAMAAGLPVIASNAGGPREIVSDGVTGLLVRPGDVNELASAILQLLKSSSRRLEMGSAGRERAKRLFDLDHQALMFQEAISSLIN